LNILDGQLEAEGVVAGAFTVKVVDKDAPTIGEATLEKGKFEVVVYTEAVTDKSKIFVTPLGPSPVDWIVSDVQEGIGFTIYLSELAAADMNFNWWIIESEN